MYVLIILICNIDGNNVCPAITFDKAYLIYKMVFVTYDGKQRMHF